MTKEKDPARAAEDVVHAENPTSTGVTMAVNKSATVVMMSQRFMNLEFGSMTPLESARSRLRIASISAIRSGSGTYDLRARARVGTGRARRCPRFFLIKRPRRRFARRGSSRRASADPPRPP